MIPINSETSLLCVLGGVTGAGSRVLRSVGKGVTALSANKEYLKKRRTSFARPSHGVSEGFARGGRRLVMVSIVSHCR